MTALQWNDDLNVGVPFMDADHVEAAAGINRMAEAAGEARADELRHFIAHCREHFGHEEKMMQETGFFAFGCHQDEHERVLAQLETVLQRLTAGEAQDGYFTADLPAWLLNHRNTMDFVTAEFARRAGWQG